MEYFLDINPRPFDAIKNGTKKIECRTPTDHNKHIDFKKLKAGDLFLMENNETKERMKVKILDVRHYLDARSLLEAEGTRNVLSSKSTLNEGVEMLNGFQGYKEGIKKNGIYAIEVVRI